MTLTIIQLIVAAILIALILLQERSAGLSGIFGGESGGGFYQTRRGLERLVFAGTIVLGALFAGIAVLRLVF